MKYLLRPLRNAQSIAAIAVVAAMTVNGPGLHAQVTQIRQFFQEMNPLLTHSASQGYLGVLVQDVDTETAQKFRLKDTRGAMVTLIDHDAPAGASLHLYDVVLQVNGQDVQNAEQFGRMLHELPAGRNTSLTISRDGNIQTIAVQLVDRKAMERDVWNKMNSSQPISQPATMGILPGGGDSLPLWHSLPFGGTLNVGAIVEPLASQTADFLGVPGGVWVKQVSKKSEAAEAGLRAHDIILKVGTETISTTADWDRALHANQGKSVQIAILRERRQQTISLQVDSRHH